MLRADFSQSHNFMDSLNPDHIIQENKAIPVFFAENFMQEYMAKFYRNLVVFSNTQRQMV